MQPAVDRENPSLVFEQSYISSWRYSYVVPNRPKTFHDLMSINVRVVPAPKRPVKPTSTAKPKPDPDMSTAGMLSHAGCQPYDQVVDIPNPDPNVVMYPACVVVKRCGGCCGHPSLTCRAISKGSTKAMVMRYVYDGTLRPARQVTYEQIEYHKTCECGCKIEEKHCNAQLHNYDNFDCKCVCKNDHQARSCPTNKRWNPDLCACQCIEISNCGASYVFDPELCRCVPGFENSGSNNNGFSSSNNNGAIGPLTAAPQPDNKVTVTETVDPCSHLQCPASYTTMMRRGRCRCVVNRG